MRSLGLDIGARRIGVALSDPLGISASPLEVLHDHDPEQLRRYVEAKRSEGIDRVVVGLPLTLQGREGEQARSTREYARALESIDGIALVLWDERLSTREARTRLKEAGRGPRNRWVDAEAAAVILQSFLERAAVRSDAEEDDGT